MLIIGPNGLTRLLNETVHRSLGGPIRPAVLQALPKTSAELRKVSAGGTSRQGGEGVVSRPKPSSNQGLSGCRARWS